MPSQMLISPPTFFAVTYELPDNRWMNISDQPDPEIAWQEWSNMKAAYRRLKVNLIEEPPGPNLPDFTFVANAGLSFRDKFILSNFRYAERRPEKEFHRFFFREMGAKIIELHPNTYFEGQGDAVWFADGLLLGYGFRTSLDAASQLEKIIGAEVLPVQLVTPALGDKIFYHLDTCYLHLEHAGVSLGVRRAFSPESWRKLSRLCDLIDLDTVDPQAAESLFCNSIEIDRTLVTPYISKPLDKILARYDYSPLHVNTGQFLKSGGAVRCLTLQFNR